MAYDPGYWGEYEFSVIFARFGGRWILCKHRGRESWETSGGHIEPGETPGDAARRELFEETGALDFSLDWVCDYASCEKPESPLEKWSKGAVFFAEVSRLGPLPESEMERIALFDAFPMEKALLTYPQITRAVFPKVLEKLRAARTIVDNP